MSVADAKRATQSYSRLIGTQIHFCQKVFQKKLKSSLLNNLPVGNCIIIFDFGENLKIGRSHDPTEGTERFLSLCTIFAAVLTYRDVIGKKTTHGLVFSNELKHTAHTATKCAEVFVSDDRISKILSEMTVAHFFSDRGKHFDYQEFSDWVLRVLPTKFPNLLITFDHRHAAKHGRDIADVSVSLAQRATDELSKRKVGFHDPKKQLVEIREIIDEWKEISLTKNSTVIVLWYEAKPVNISYEHLRIDRIDASSCRRSTRSKAGGELKFSDHIRFDVKAGLYISPNLVTSQHLGLFSNPADAVKSDDAFVCSVERQIFRQNTRLETLSFLSKQTDSDLSSAILGQTPVNLSVELKVDVQTISYVLRKDSRKRATPPPFSARCASAKKRSFYFGRPTK